MAKLVSKTYAGALFSVGKEEGLTDVLYQEAQFVREAWRENEDLAKLAADPQIIKEDKMEFLSRVFESRVSPQMAGLLMTAAKKDRLKDIPAILDEFIELVRADRKIGRAQVVSAVPLSDAWKEKVEARLKETTGFASIDMEYVVDPEIIGGVRIRVGDRIMDSSLKTQLANMTRELKQIVI